MGALHILLLEDEPDDAELIARTISQAGIECVLKHVHSEATFLAALDRGPIDLILADYAVPRFDGIAALQAAAARRPGVPVIILSGVIEEDLAIEMLKVGASDYVLKGRLDRLAPVMLRCLRESRNARRVWAGIRAAALQMRRSLDVLTQPGAVLNADGEEAVRRLADALESVERVLDEQHRRPEATSPS